jgi:hypothetical protein
MKMKSHQRPGPHQREKVPPRAAIVGLETTAQAAPLHMSLLSPSLENEEEMI